MNNSFEFLRDMASFADTTNSIPKNKLARIDPEYDPTKFPGILPRVIFDGEKVLTRKRYYSLSPYIPEPGDRVLMVPVSTSYIIAGCVDQKRSGVYRAESEEINSSGTRQNSSFGDLSEGGFGPSLSLTTGSKALVIITSLVGVSSGTGAAIVGVQVSGATTISPSDERSLGYDSQGTGSGGRNLAMSHATLYEDLNPGVNTFTMKYRTTGAPVEGNFHRRKLTVLPL